MSEQERADLLAHEIDRLLAGERVDSDDPLLGMVRKLAQLPVQPSDLATARFESQLHQWFGSPAARPLRIAHPQPIIAAVLVAALVAITISVLILPNHLISGPRSVPLTPTPLPTVTPTSTITPTASPDATATAFATAHSTPVFSLIIISGSIDSIQRAVIFVLGQAISLDKVPTNLCVGDVVRIEADADLNNVLHADHSAITVVTSACTNPPPAPQRNQSSGGSGGAAGKNHTGDEEHH
jgi:hypothetical protein